MGVASEPFPSVGSHEVHIPFISYEKASDRIRSENAQGQIFPQNIKVWKEEEIWQMREVCVELGTVVQKVLDNSLSWGRCS